MPTRTMALAVAALLLVCVWAGRPLLFPDLSHFRWALASGTAPFPPVPARSPGSRVRPDAIVVTPLDRQVAVLGRRAPRYPDAVRRRYAEAPDLMRLALDVTPKAASGDGVSEYVLYLVLEQCRNYLRLNADTARVLTDRMTTDSDLNPEERSAWNAEYERCRGFAGGDWSAVGEALGDERPGAETEYASVWFERATDSGFAPAEAEQALRPGPLGTDERVGLLRDALPARDPDAYWLVFAHSGDVPSGEISAPALAWLLLACRAGADCTEHARWYRGYACAQAGGSCVPGLSAAEYYWFAAAADVREAAWALADRIDADIKAQRWDRVPLPELAGLDNRAKAGVSAPAPEAAAE